MMRRMDPAFLKPYNPNEHEADIYAKWEKSGAFQPKAGRPGADRSEPFTILMPPPNANGNLHVGHALGITLQDIMIRYRRMAGYKTLWLPGADHAGFETQVVYEKKLEKEGRSRFSMERDELYKEILAFTLENKTNMEAQVRSLGASCDWSREKFTLDESIIATVYDTFKKLYKDKLLYRGSRIINWCPKHQTSLSNLETRRETRTDKFYYLQYGPFVIATARPETKFGDKYVVMHPSDKRYEEFTDGQQFELEWINGRITATVIKDEAIDMELGSGVMTITPWHDPIDFEIAQRHQLPYEQIIDWRGKLLPIAGEFAGMSIKDAREKIVEKLGSKGLVEKIDAAYSHEVPVCYKCGREIEPQIKEQWFVKMQPLAEKAIEAVQSKKVKIVTESHEKILLHWLENIQDWNISRQIAWGIPIPAWSKDGEWQIGESSPGNGWVKDPDTFDTWFSSGQWPFATLGYPDGEDYKNFYPTTVMETAYDILFFWVARMIMLGLYCTGKVPFHTVYLHGLVRDASKQKMSKSKGNVVNPLTVMQEYGTDALRLALIIGNTPGTDLALSLDKVRGYKHFANKLWNITRFILERFDEAPATEKPELTDGDSAWLASLSSLTKEVTKDIEQFRFHLAGEKLYHYVWHSFADKMIEECKVRFKNSSEADQTSARYTLGVTLVTLLKVLHPFTPFVTEAIWQRVPLELRKLLGDDTPLLIRASWPHSSH